MKRLSFPKSKRLVNSGQFKDVLDKKLGVSDGFLLLYVAKNDCGYQRLGVSVGKRLGNAVIRNRLKRLLREAFRQSQEQIPAGLDYVLMISPQWSKKFNNSTETKEAVKQLTFDEVKASFLTLVDDAVKKIK